MIARTLIMASLALFIVSVSTPVYAAKYELIFDSDELLKSGKRAIQKGQLEKAAYYYEEALRRKNLSRTDMIELRSDLCVAYMYLNRFDEAIEQCQLGIELMPNRWETHNNLGTVFLIQGDFESAIAQYEKALKMNPNSRVLKFNHDIAIQRAAEFQSVENRSKKNEPLEEGPGDYGSSAAGLN